MAFVQGFLAAITLDGNVVTLVSTDVALDRSTTALEKTVMDGSGTSTMLPGLRSGSLSLNGHVDQANLNLLEVTHAKDTVVPFIMEINEGLTTDGSYAGNIAITEFSVGTVFDGNWSFTLSGDTSGATTYTPSAP